MLSMSLIENLPPPYATLKKEGENSNSSRGHQGQGQGQPSDSDSCSVTVAVPMHEISIDSMTPTRNPYSNNLVESILGKGQNGYGADKWYKNNYVIMALGAVNFALIIWIICLHATSSTSDSDLESEDGFHSMDKNRTYPRFFDETNYQGAFYTPHPNWEKSGCVKMPRWFNDKAMSIQTGTGNLCLEVCEADDCSLYYRKVCEKVFKGSYSHNDLEKIHMDRKISSFKLCS